MGINLNSTEQRLLLKIARESISEYLTNKETKRYDEIVFPSSILQKAGSFVTLRNKGELRGCIGRFNSVEPLYLNVQKMAINAASKDHRFQPVRFEELPVISIEISVISPLERINSPEEFDIEKHGIYIKKDGRTGTFLPQVAKQTRWTKEELLGHCARDKAGLNWNDWKTAEIYIYTAQIFVE